MSIDGDGSQIEVARAPTENPLSWDLDDAAFDDSLAGTLSQSDEVSFIVSLDWSTRSRFELLETLAKLRTLFRTRSSTCIGELGCLTR